MGASPLNGSFRASRVPPHTPKPNPPPSPPPPPIKQLLYTFVEENEEDSNDFEDDAFKQLPLWALNA